MPLMHRRFAIALSICALAAGGWAAPTAQAQNLLGSGATGCRDDLAACWYMVFGKGDAPSRTLYIANGKTRTLPGGEVSIEAIEMFEAPDKYNFVSSTLEFDCKAKKMRIPRAYAQQVDGKIERAPPRDQSWVPVPVYSWIGQVFKLACDPTAKAEPQKQHMLWVSDLPRAADVIPLTRRIFWEREFSPNGGGKKRR